MVSRRAFLKGAGAAIGAAALGGALARAQGSLPSPAHHGHGLNDVTGAIRTDDFDPYAFLTSFSLGDRVTSLESGKARREWRVVAVNRDIEVAPGVSFPAWTFNAQVPGPTLRAREGDRVSVEFVNASPHSHTMHFHGIHAAEMDGVPGIGPGEIPPGGRFTYEFEARPHGVHLYHCHALPLKRHVHKGLYGAYIVDPPEGWGEPANEMVMVMNGFDTDGDGANDVYAVNSKAFAYARRPIQVKRGELQRVFLVNMTEFDPLNSFHLHANFFRYREIGHTSNAWRFTDNVHLIQAERGVLEFTFEFPGRYMFQAHQSEFTELGWMGFFEVS